MRRRAYFLPFQFRNTEDHIRIFSLLSVMREGDYPVPQVVGTVLTICSQDDLRKYAQDIQAFCGQRGQLVTPTFKQEALRALDTLAYFHSLSCQSTGPCLGQEIEKMMDDFTS
jgi:hypothetical protein